jgi:flagellar biosynthesis protein FlhF
MSVQIFRGRTVTEARRAAVARMGADAVVVTTRTVRKPGVAGWFAGSEIELAAMPAGDEHALTERTEKGKVVPFAAGVYSVPPPTNKGPDIASLRAELKGDIRALKTMLAKTDDSSWLSAEIGALRELLEGMSAAQPRRDRVAAFLQTIGLEGPAATVVARSLKGKALDGESLRVALPEVLKATAWPLDSPRALVALVGSAGVGKTTTAAKLAARARMAKKSVTLIGCDTFRIGAVEQLSRYADLMDASFVTARNADELQNHITGARTDVVIVDTAGRHPTADGVEIALAPSEDRGRFGDRTRHVLLCAPAAIRAADASRLARRYANLGPTGLVITKLDETETPAGLVHAGWAAKLAIAVICNGPRVPEDIAPVNVSGLIDYLAPAMKGQVAA